MQGLDLVMLDGKRDENEVETAADKLAQEILGDGLPQFAA